MRQRKASRLRISFFAVRLASLLCVCFSCSFAGWSGEPSFSDRLALSTDAVAPRRFIAVHGRNAAIMGYSERGLEVWAYPFQVLDSYQIGFRPAGAATESEGRLLLRRVIERPESVTRIYIGPDYIVREKLFVPLQGSGAVLSYEVEGGRAVDICIHFRPVLNLMWPGAIGGQSTTWDAAISGYLISEPKKRISAVIASAETVQHDDTENDTLRDSGKLSFSVRPRTDAAGPARANVYVALQPGAAQDPAAAVRALSSHRNELEARAAGHYADLEHEALQIHTPDEAVNSALAWAEVALDQAWVCNPELGCGIVAGYGPSRAARRPQYAWFFAGDGLVAVNALLSAGEYSRARDELEFIRKYQDRTTGMVWHELSQSAGYLDWSKYPYMFVHVDISFDYLSTVARYVSVSGDTSFAADFWPSIAAAYRYCTSLIPATDHLPHIPRDKEGGDEQDRPSDDLGLSVSWLAASTGFAQLATLTGHLQQAEEATRAAQLARPAIKSRYWDAQSRFWIGGHTTDGAPIIDHRSGPARAISEDIFSPKQNDEIMDQLASSAFESDWGTRGVAAGTGIFSPTSYSKGSVSALNTFAIATMFWQAHRSTTAFAIWSSILPWNTLDSLGHLHEVLAGDFYHEQMESVPEQTWSSAGMLDASVRGLLGLEIQGAAGRIRFAPHLPAQWNWISVDRLRLPRATLALTLRQQSGETTLEIRNEGISTKILFEPQIPLGARLIGAEFQGRPIAAEARQFSEDEHAKLEIEAPPGLSECRLRFSGGVSFLLSQTVSRLGDPSTGMKIIALSLKNRVLSVDASLHRGHNDSFRIQTPWRIAAVRGGTIRSLSGTSYDVSLERQGAPEDVLGYAPAHAEIVFADK